MKTVHLYFNWCKDLFCYSSTLGRHSLITWITKWAFQFLKRGKVSISRKKGKIAFFVMGKIRRSSFVFQVIKESFKNCSLVASEKMGTFEHFILKFSSYMYALLMSQLRKKASSLRQDWANTFWGRKWRGQQCDDWYLLENNNPNISP